MISPRVQVDDIKPPGPVWPQRSIDKLKPRDKEQKRDGEKRDTGSHDENGNKDGHSIDEYA